MVHSPSFTIKINIHVGKYAIRPMDGMGIEGYKSSQVNQVVTNHYYYL